MPHPRTLQFLITRLRCPFFECTTLRDRGFRDQSVNLRLVSANYHSSSPSGSISCYRLHTAVSRFHSSSNPSRHPYDLKEADREANRALLKMDEEEEAELRQILRSRNQSNPSNWQEPVSVWRNDQTGEIKWISAEDIPAETDASSDCNPWFVDEPEPEPSVAAELSSASISSPAPPAPENLPSEFLPLYRYLIDSPFVERSSISFIDAKAEPYGQGEAAWTDWVVVVQMKEGREGGIRGATEAVREILSAASSAKVRIEGISGNPSTSWSMVDGGKIVVHVLTKESREMYQIEDIWTGRPSNSTNT